MRTTIPVVALTVALEGRSGFVPFLVQVRTIRAMRATLVLWMLTFVGIQRAQWNPRKFPKRARSLKRTMRRTTKLVCYPYILWLSTYCISSADDYLINSAPAPQLQRLRKDDLLRLYALAGLSDDAESLTKSEIVDCIVAARDDLASLPPSSPPGRGGDLSDYSSDDGNFAENEADEERADETPRGVFSLRRRATTTDVCHLNGRPSKGRSLSLGQMNDSTAAVPSALSKKLSGKSSPTGVLK